MKRLFAGIFFLLLILVMFNGPANAERQCTNTVVTNPDGTKSIISDCSSSFERTTNSDIIRNPHVLNRLQNDIFDKTNDALQAVRDRAADQSVTQTNPDQIAQESQQKEQAVIDAVRIKQEEQKSKLEDSRH